MTENIKGVTKCRSTAQKLSKNVTERSEAKWWWRMMHPDLKWEMQPFEEESRKYRKLHLHTPLEPLKRCWDARSMIVQGYLHPVAVACCYWRDLWEEGFIRDC